MKKKKKALPKEEPPVIELAFGPKAKEYDDYLKEHRNKLRRLQREADGSNLYEPDYGDY